MQGGRSDEKFHRGISGGITGCGHYHKNMSAAKGRMNHFLENLHETKEYGKKSDLSVKDTLTPGVIERIIKKDNIGI